MAPPELQELVRATELGQDLSEQEFDMIVAHNKIVSFNRNETILQQGTIAEGIYLVISGKVIITAKILGEGTVELGKSEQGCLLGEISFIEKIPSASSIIAEDEVKCLVITRLYFELLSTYYPKTKFKLFYVLSKQICRRLKIMHDTIAKEISNTAMAERSFFREIIRSITKPQKLTFAEAHIDPNRLQFISAELFKHGMLLRAPKNCILIDKGEHVPCCFIVLQGAVQSSILYDNKMAKLSVIGPTTLFASVACIDKNSRFTITFSTCEPTILLKFSEDDLLFFEKNYPELWYKLFDHIFRSLVVLEKSVDKLQVRLNVEIYNR